ncbi:hypothetical protein [Geodermatophilus normandii]|uniref:Uncharacterized protein n=1 Tax=Geodermatophilus normandii TaxID=1137989 RepID=A0A6P0GMM6_9ACTN|nr:hypothetical protein [Geodermatophilus normandii]NEM08514.1 hypothetical protein [Geodermatophilus normandii]
MRTAASLDRRRPTWPSGDPVTVGHPSSVRPDDDTERRARRSAFLLPAVVLRLGVPRMVPTGEYAGLHGDLAWTVLAAVTVLTAAVPLLAPLVPALERRAADTARLHVALHTHPDPGPRLRGRLELVARQVVRLHGVGRLLPVLPLVLLQADRDRPGAVPAASWWEPWLGGRRLLALTGIHTFAVVVVVLVTG